MTRYTSFKSAYVFLLTLVAVLFCTQIEAQNSEGSDQKHSVARAWNEALLSAIRLDTARPTVHARNLFHLSAAMWDAWAAYEPEAKQLFHTERGPFAQINKEDKQSVSISYAAHTLLIKRFERSLNYERIHLIFEQTLTNSISQHALNPQSLAKARNLGKDIAIAILQSGLQDGSNETEDYRNRVYQPVNQPLNPHWSNNPLLDDPDRWQSLELPEFVGQSGIRSDGYPPFVGAEWGDVTPFALMDSDVAIKERAAKLFKIYLDAGAPPSLKGDSVSSDAFIQNFKEVLEFGRELDPNNSKIINTSPRVRGNKSLGSNISKGYAKNPITNEPYLDNHVLAADYYRVLAEFWADGPDSETPPGHWFVIFNQVSDHPSIEYRFNNQLRARDRLEWDVSGYLALGGAMHDAAVAAWSHKGWYDHVRPISAIRHLCKLGQSSDPELPNYHPQGMKLDPGLVELRMDSTKGNQKEGKHSADGSQALDQVQKDLHKVMINTWRGPSHVENPETDIAGVGWIPCDQWWPYQRPNFVTPPFAGYVSGHSTFSRAAAEVLTLLTGSRYFPGGLAVFNIKKDNFLIFERGPSADMQLQWATYQDAADDCSLSRIYGGIHPSHDDIPGRRIGYEVGIRAFKKAQSFFRNTTSKNQILSLAVE